MHWGSDKALAGALAALALMLGGGAARGDGEPVDRSYGRVDGDLTLVAGAGVVVAPRGLRAEGEVRLRYLESAGLFLSYEDAPIVGSPSEPQRVLATGLEVRPLFFFRWLKGNEMGPERLDLLIDSFGIELGADFAQPEGRGFASQWGLQAGIGLELPLLRDVSGPWIGMHGGMRWSTDALSSGMARTVDDRAGFLALTLAWHQLVRAHLVDPGDQPLPLP